MSLASTQAEAQFTPPLPMPPAGGWKLARAADVLRPRLGQVYRAKSPDSEIEVRAKRQGIWRFVSHLEERLTENLLETLCERADLQLTGYPQAEGVYAKKIAVPRAHLDAALWAARNQLEQPRMEIAFSLTRDEVLLIFHDPSAGAGPRTEVLLGARIEVADDQSLNLSVSKGVTAVMASGGQRPSSSKKVGLIDTKLEFSRNVLRPWFLIFASDHPKHLPKPNEAACVAAVSQHFGAQVSRELVRKVRRQIAPHWLGKGPSKPRNQPPTS